jgi:transcriptional regulator with XRE-family HTH domain
MITATPGEQIREVREYANLTQEQLVSAINHRRPKGAQQINQSHLSAMENDQHVPTLTLLREIADATGHRVEDRLFVEFRK